MKKGIVAGMTILVILSAGLGFSTWMLSGLKVNGAVMSTDNTDKIERVLVEEFHKNGIFADEGLDWDFVNVKFDMSALEGRDLMTCLTDRFNREDYEVAATVTVDEEAVRAYFKERNETAMKPENARISKDETLIKEIQGTQVDIDALLADATPQATGIRAEDYYLKPAITSEYLQKRLDKKKKIANWSITYQDGTRIEAPDEAVHIDAKGKITVDGSFLDTEVKKLVDQAASAKPVSFKNHNGEKIQLTTGYWGRYVDYEKEAAWAKKKFEKGESVEDREPIRLGNTDTIKGTFVEVSIDEQMLYLHEKGKITAKTPVVTGRTGGRDTPRGAYYILERVPGKYLVGAGYRTWVNRWMRLTYSGVGLHDAGWRGNFGGSIYRSNGSHGCVNLPKNFAYSLYEKTYLGMPVVIY